jgi:xanthine dehydrogenase accessory factor
MGSGAARLLFLAGFEVLILERPRPLAVRRQVAFAEAVFAGSVVVEGVSARLVETAPTPPHDSIPVLVDHDGLALSRLSPRVLVDARMAKRNLGTHKGLAPLVIGLGPGFVAGEDVHAVVETQRGPRLGSVIWSGPPEPDSKVPAAVLGVTENRVLRAPVAGVFRGRARIGDLVDAFAVVGEVAGVPVTAQIAGQVRGLLSDGVEIAVGAKVGDIDPRGGAVDAARVSEKARAISAGVLEAVLVHLRS